MKSFSVRLDGSECYISSFCTVPNGVLLECLLTNRSKRNQGQAKKVLRAVKKWALRKKVSVLLYIGAFFDRPLDNGQLFRFYSKMGFIPYKPDYVYVGMPQFMIFNNRV